LLDPEEKALKIASMFNCQEIKNIRKLPNDQKLYTYSLDFNRQNSTGQYNSLTTPGLGDSVGSFIEKIRNELLQNFVTYFKYGINWNQAAVNFANRPYFMIQNRFQNYNSAKTQALNTKHPHLLIPTCGLIMEPLIAMLDMGRISYLTRHRPAFFRKILDFIMAPVVEKFKLMCESDSPILLVPDDCAYKGRPILNPIHYKEFVDNIKFKIF
jgi:hypothetical protein